MITQEFIKRSDKDIVDMLLKGIDEQIHYTGTSSYEKGYIKALQIVKDGILKLRREECQYK